MKRKWKYLESKGCVPRNKSEVGVWFCFCSGVSWNWITIGEASRQVPLPCVDIWVQPAVGRWWLHASFRRFCSSVTVCLLPQLCAICRPSHFVENFKHWIEQWTSREGRPKSSSTVQSFLNSNVPACLVRSRLEAIFLFLCTFARGNSLLGAFLC